jgi:hypothetical protein
MPALQGKVEQKELIKQNKNVVDWAPVAHACDPSYSRGKDQEDCGSKPAWANSSARHYLKTPFIKIGLMEWLKVNALSSSPSITDK